jgi:hypothetical protein
MFWLSMMNGAAGHTYGANGIWQCNRPGEPHGPSPHHNGGVGYGKIPWDESMSLPGSAQVGLGKKLFEKFAWQKFEPHPEWVQPASASAWQPHWGERIWYPEAEPTKNAPVEKRYFRYTFTASNIDEATLWLSVDDRFVAWLNGQQIAAGADWRSAAPVNAVLALRDGKNVLAIEAENLPGPVDANPAGLLASLLVLTDAGERYENIRSDETWRCAKNVDQRTNDWRQPTFDDSKWSRVKVLGDARQLPWGEPAVPKDIGPFAVGIPREVRLVYSLPRSATSSLSRNVCVRGLEPNVTYDAQAFNPTTGETTPLYIPQPTNGSCFITNPSATSNDDWLLILQAKAVGIDSRR